MPSSPADVDGSELVVDVEPGGPQHHIGRPMHPVDGRDPVRGELGDAVGDQFDVVALQRGQPGSVVLQRPLAHRRVVRRDLGQQFLVGAEHPHPRDEYLADRVIDSLNEVRRCPSRGRSSSARRARRRSATTTRTAATFRNTADVGSPTVRRADRCVVDGVRRHPLRGALVDVDLGGGVRDRRARAGIRWRLLR